MTKKQQTITVWLIVAAIIGLVVLIAVLGSRASTSSSPIPEVTSADHISGPITAKAVLVEYSDFQCPACAAYQPIVKQLQQEFGDKLALVYREYPLRQTHKSAQIAAQAAEAADKQGKFWSYHDMLFDRQTSWPQALNVEQTFVDYAKELGLDTAKFSSDYNSQAVKDRIEVDVKSGDTANIPGTPTFYLNGTRINPQSFNEFKSLIDSSLAS